MNNCPYEFGEVLSVVNAAGSALLFCHVSPDGDCLGSALALGEMLTGMGKRAQVMVDGDIPENLHFLPGWESILNAQQEPDLYDTVIAVDVSDANRLGACRDLFFACRNQAVIDHHENPGYAECNMIDPQAPATAILIHRICLALNQPITKKMAVCLYTALSTDTGNFIYDSTNAEAFSMMQDLMNAGLPLGTTGRELFRTKELPFVRLLSEVLPTLRLLGNCHIAGLLVTRQAMENAGANDGHRDGLVDYAIDIRGVGLAYLASETPEGGIKFSLRAKAPYHVAELARSFGGGGHDQAAGCTLSLPMGEAVAKVEAALEEELKKA